MSLFAVDDTQLDDLLAPKTNAFRRVPHQAMDAVVGGALQRLGHRSDIAAGLAAVMDTIAAARG